MKMPAWCLLAGRASLHRVTRDRGPWDGGRNAPVCRMQRTVGQAGRDINQSGWGLPSHTVHLLKIVFGDWNEKPLLRKAPCALDVIIQQAWGIVVRAWAGKTCLRLTSSSCVTSGTFLILEMSLNFTVYKMGIIVGGRKYLKNSIRKSLCFFLAHRLKSSYHYSNTAWSSEDGSKYEGQRLSSLPGKALLPAPGATLNPAQVWSLDYSALWCAPLVYAAITKHMTNLHALGSELPQTC